MNKQGQYSITLSTCGLLIRILSNSVYKHTNYISNTTLTSQLIWLLYNSNLVQLTPG